MHHIAAGLYHKCHNAQQSPAAPSGPTSLKVIGRVIERPNFKLQVHSIRLRHAYGSTDLETDKLRNTERRMARSLWQCM